MHEEFQLTRIPWSVLLAYISSEQGFIQAIFMSVRRHNRVSSPLSEGGAEKFSMLAKGGDLHFLNF